ncbi:hypothetical protein RhiirA1_479537 [Rhizophagus irregularis]|uniref:Protein kinase domain-containing protein n=1 Tax=Rhizophagus irregularis TaxID=588596 RepID=A0A2N0QQI1_9GLOM|nr:hypothetical protein RhiirA1_479537 [Rhizophagus irregularis]
MGFDIPIISEALLKDLPFRAFLFPLGKLNLWIVNSKFGTSGSKIVNQCISKNKLKWVCYDKFENIEYHDKGGFGTIYIAKYISIEVILKYFDYLNNSDESLNELLNEWKIINSDEIINIYGFTNKNSLKRYLTEITKSWEQKLFYLFQIINKGLNDIHKKDLIHYNFHNVII